MKKLYFILILLLTLFTVSCENSADKSQQSKSTQVRISADQVKVINTSDYDQIKTDNKGKVILINFFASWCDSCRQEIPGFVKAYAELKDSGLQIIGLSVDKTKEEVAKFVNQFDINFPVYFADDSIRKKFNVTYLPTNIIYDTNGSLLNVHVGFISEDDIHTLVKKYVSK